MAVGLWVDASETVNFAMQQNGVPVVRAVRVENGSGRDLAGVRIVVSASRAVFEPLELRLDVLPAGGVHRFEPVGLVLDPAMLCNQAEREQIQLVVEAFAGEAAVGRVVRPLEVMAFNEWHGAGGLADLIAAFVTPNHPSVEGLLAEARDALGRMTGDPSLSGYQAKSPERVLLMVQAAAAAFRGREIGYVNPPASFERTGQKVRSADQVLDGRLGTCLDLVVALAGVLEQIGLNTLVVLLKNHAVLGVWLRDDRFPQTVVDDRAILAKRVQLGEVVLLETTALVAGSNAEFAAVQAAAVQRLAKAEEFVCAVDIAACRRERVRPLPSRVAAGGAFQVAASEEAGSAGGAALLERRAEAGTATRRVPRAAAEVAAAPEGLSGEASDRLARWKRKLLDLSLRNRMLNFRETAKSVPLLVPDIAALEDALAEGRPLKVLPKPGALRGLRGGSGDSPAGISEGDGQAAGEGAVDRGALLERLREGGVCAGLPAGELGDRLLGLYREARTSLEESGAGTLYLALGSLVWYESSASEAPRVAPLVLVPVRLVRNLSGQAYTIELADEEARVNVTLLEKLRTDFGIDGGHLERLEQDESGYDVRAAIQGFVELVKDVPRWEVRPDAVLSLFSFAKFVMWTDLELRAGQIAGSKVVRRMLDHSAGPAFPEIEPVEEPDRPAPAGGALSAVDADSSQLAAVHAAMGGRTFVLQGPPGTGKSQTITNILASAIASGKRVLFVAEKMAALGVVKSRLQRLGLGPYCLELHSNKSGKKDVLAQLKEALEAPGLGEPAEWAERVGDAEAARAELNAYVRALHGPRASGETVYSVIGRRGRCESAPEVALPLAGALNVTRERLRALRGAVADMAQAAEQAGVLANHPLRGVGVRAWKPGLAEELRRGAEQLGRAVGGLRDAAAGALATLGVGPGCDVEKASASELVWLVGVAARLLEGAAPTEALLKEMGWEGLRAALAEEIALGRERDAALATIRARYRETLLSEDLDALQRRAQEAAASGWLMRWWRTRGVRAALRVHALDPRGSAIEVIPDIECARRASAARQRLASPESVGRRLLGVRWGAEGQWDAAARSAEWADKTRALLASRPEWRGLGDQVVDAVLRLATVDADRLAPGGAARRALEKLAGAMQEFDGAWGTLDAHAALRRGEIVQGDEAGFLRAITAATLRWGGALDQLPAWCGWREASALERFEELLPLAAALMAGTVAPGQAADAFERAFATAWLAEVFEADEALRRFSLAKQSAAVERFRAADAAIVQLGGAVVRARRAQAAPPLPAAQANPQSEVGLLRSQIALTRRHMPVRRLVEKLPNLLPRLKPCWLMSPMSVAQYLDPKLPPFDLVVFDEASQIPPWDAVGALARGAEAVIVGDSKQLPPTNFFAKLDSGEAEDEAEFDELESVLDEAVASGLPSMSLLWHYRSRHESLIAFSNHHYYDNRLLTFPSPEATVPGLGVSMVHLPDGRYDKGASRTNVVEARAVAGEVVRRLRAAGDGAVSLGVVTFSVAQQHLVEDLLDAERRKDPRLERFFAGGADEPVFIKNLENVQGDERDVILFSVCYGPQSDGQVSMNFGPINRLGGERRLNVAITRARREVMVFSSLRPEQIDLSRTRAVGAAHLRSFLDYAQRGPRAILEAARPGEATESPFEEVVRAALVARGHRVDAQVGCSGYRIDLAVKDPAQPGRYLLGIECDGASYHSAKAARDRDRLREQVLRGLGWRIHRVWSTDWFQSPQGALARIERAIKDAAAGIEPAPPLPPPPAARTGTTASGSSPAARADALTARSEAARSAGEAGPGGGDAGSAGGEAGSAGGEAGSAGGEAGFAGGEAGPGGGGAGRAIGEGGPARIASAAALAAERAVASEPARARGAKAYDQVTLAHAKRDAERFRDRSAIAQAAADVKALVEAEAPVHIDRVEAVLAEAWGIERMTSRARDAFDDSVERAIREGGARRDGAFLLSARGEALSDGCFRVPAAQSAWKRPIEHIHPAEIALAARDVLEKQLSLPMAALCTEVSRVFGIQRTGPRGEAAVRSGIELLASQGRCRIQGEMVSV